MVRRAIIISIKWFLQEMSEALGVLIELPEKVMLVSGPSGLITTLPAMARYIYQKLKKILCTQHCLCVLLTSEKCLLLL